MADPFVAEIRIFPFNFAPRGWAWCNGQLMPISQNTALFSLLWTTYGGDGKSTFALPDLQGRVPMHPGQGPGLSLYDLGEQGGAQNVTLMESEIPMHNHNLMGGNSQASLNTPDNNSAISRTEGPMVYRSGKGGATSSMAWEALAPIGVGTPHNNMQPFLTMFFCIALQGVFPPRT